MQRRHCDKSTCGWYHRRRNTPADRDPDRSPEQQNYILRVDAPPLSIVHSQKHMERAVEGRVERAWWYGDSRAT